MGASGAANQRQTHIEAIVTPREPLMLAARRKMSQTSPTLRISAAAPSSLSTRVVAFKVPPPS